HGNQSVHLNRTVFQRGDPRKDCMWQAYLLRKSTQSPALLPTAWLDTLHNCGYHVAVKVRSCCHSILHEIMRRHNPFYDCTPFIEPNTYLYTICLCTDDGSPLGAQTRCVGHRERQPFQLLSQSLLDPDFHLCR